MDNQGDFITGLVEAYHGLDEGDGLKCRGKALRVAFTVDPRRIFLLRRKDKAAILGDKVFGGRLDDLIIIEEAIKLAGASEGRDLHRDAHGFLGQGQGAREE